MNIRRERVPEGGGCDIKDSVSNRTQPGVGGVSEPVTEDHSFREGV